MTPRGERAFCSFLTLTTTFFWTSLGIAAYQQRMGLAIACAILATVATFLTFVFILGDD